MTGLFVSCGDSGDAATATTLTITAGDYGFEAPDTIKGGTVEINFTNNGKEPHFAGLARVAPGKTVDDVRAALVARLPRHRSAPRRSRTTRGCRPPTPDDPLS